MHTYYYVVDLGHQLRQHWFPSHALVASCIRSQHCGPAEASVLRNISLLFNHFTSLPFLCTFVFTHMLYVSTL